MKTMLKVIVAAGCATMSMLPNPASAQIGNVPPATLNTPILHVGLFTIRPDGSAGAHAVETARSAGEPFSGAVYLAPCATIGAVSGVRPLPASATEAWRLSGRVLALTEAQTSLQLTWHKIRQNGQDVALPGNTVNLTLNRGERVRLDGVTVQAAGLCPERTAAFDAVFASLNEMIPSVGPAFRTVGSWQAGRGAFVTTVEGGDAVTRFAVAGRRRNVTSADLWLVHAAPGSADETRHVAVDSLSSFPREFSFSPVAIPIAAGVLTVLVQGTIEMGLTPEGEPRLYFSANRRVTFAPGGRAPRDTAPVVEASTKTAVPMPGPDDVLAFEMPPLRVPGGDAVPNKLSVRVRVVQGSVP
jgi:hypothetical protein